MKELRTSRSDPPASAEDDDEDDDEDGTATRRVCSGRFRRCKETGFCYLCALVLLPLALTMIWTRDDGISGSLSDEEDGLPAWLVTTCSVVALAGCCVVGLGWIWTVEEGGYAMYVFLFGILPIGVGCCCVGVVMLIVASLLEG